MALSLMPAFCQVYPPFNFIKGGTRVLVRGGPFKGREREFMRPKVKNQMKND